MKNTFMDAYAYIFSNEKTGELITPARAYVMIGGALSLGVAIAPCGVYVIDFIVKHSFLTIVLARNFQ